MKKTKKIQRPISLLAVENVPSALYLRTEIASGAIGGEALEVCQCASGQIIIIVIGKRQFTIKYSDLVQAVYDTHVAERKPCTSPT